MWNAPGNRTAMTLMVSNDELSCTAPKNHKSVISPQLEQATAYFDRIPVLRSEGHR